LQKSQKETELISLALLRQWLRSLRTSGAV